MKKIEVVTRTHSYPILIGRGTARRAGAFLDLDRNVLIVTDENIPFDLVEAVKSGCRRAELFRIKPGEGSKSLASFEKGLKILTRGEFSRADCVVAVGGGVVGDLAGFIASAYLRGIDWYNVPTTTLSQVDSSIGGKVAVNFCGMKNQVGAFYPPKAVLIDRDVLRTLPARQSASGLAEAVKMAICFDEKLFCFLEKNDPMEHFDFVMEQSLLIKKRVVEEDETEQGLRRVLNFGHTIGHAIESVSALSDHPLTHGECVALGMIPMTHPSVRKRLVALLRKIGLPTVWEGETNRLNEYILHDKKRTGDCVTILTVPRVGAYELKKIPLSEFVIDRKGWEE